MLTPIDVKGPTGQEPRRKRLILIPMTNALRQRLTVDPTGTNVTISDAEGGWIWTTYQDAEGMPYWCARRAVAEDAVAMGDTLLLPR